MHIHRCFGLMHKAISVISAFLTTTRRQEDNMNWSNDNSLSARNSTLTNIDILWDRLCDLVSRIPDYRSRGPRFDSRLYRIFLRSTGSGAGSIQHREDKWGATWKKRSGSGLENRDSRPCGPVRETAHHPLVAKVAINFADSGGCSIGIIHLQSKRCGNCVCLLSSGIWRRVARIWTNISEEFTTCVFRVVNQSNKEP
jgi:hypothetical protein